METSKNNNFQTLKLKHEFSKEIVKPNISKYGKEIAHQNNMKATKILTCIYDYPRLTSLIGRLVMYNLCAPRTNKQTLLLTPPY